MTSAARWRRELTHSWPLLRAARYSEITTSPLPIGGQTAPLRIGVDGAVSRHLLVPLGEEDVQLETVEGVLRVELRTYTFSRVPLRYVDISCVRSDLFDLFDEVLVDVLVAVEGATDRPAATVVKVLARWRALLATRRARLLTLVGQMSLFAELTVLDLVTRDEELDISWWRGPNREPHDIVLAHHALEVKALGRTAAAVEIHGLHQLEPPGMPLSLVLATVEEAEAGSSLPDLVEHVLGRVRERGRGVQLLAAAGYTLTDAERYPERFAVTELAHVAITEGVPRIVPASFGPAGVPAGIGGLAYTVELDALDRFTARGETALLDHLRATR